MFCIAKVPEPPTEQQPEPVKWRDATSEDEGQLVTIANGDERRLLCVLDRLSESNDMHRYIVELADGSGWFSTDKARIRDDAGRE